MNNNFTIVTFFKMIWKNIFLFASVFLLVTVIGIVAGSVLYTNTYTVSATCSISITSDKNTSTVSSTDYSGQYYDNAASFIKDPSLLRQTSDLYNLELKDLQDSLSYSRSYGLIQIVYTGDTSNPIGQNVIQSVINNWIEFLEDKAFSGVTGEAKLILSPTTQTDMTSTIALFISAFAVVGFILGICASTIKSYYSKTFIDSAFLKGTVSIPLVAKYKKSNIDNELENKKLILEFARNKTKVVAFTTINGTSKNEIIKSFEVTATKIGYKVKVLDFTNLEDKETITLETSLFNFKENNPLDQKLQELKQEYDFIILNSNDESDDYRLALNKISDLTIIDIEINLTHRKQLKNEINIMEKDNKNIVGVIVD